MGWWQDIMNARQNREEVERLTKEIERIELTKEEVQYLDLKKESEFIKWENQKNLQSHKEELESITEALKLEHGKLRNEISSLQSKCVLLKSDIGEYEGILNSLEHGLYSPPRYLSDEDSSEKLKAKLGSVRAKQKALIKNKNATTHPPAYTVDGDKKKGKEFVNDTIKLLLRAFNNECDVIISGVKHTNFERSVEKVQKSFHQLNSLTDMQTVFMTTEYKKLKVDELTIMYKYRVKKQEEKEEQQAIKEQMREEARVLKEIEEARKKVEKEETHFKAALLAARTKIENASESERTALEAKIAELEAKLQEVEEIKGDIENRERNTRAGYVYVISNIGSFGEHVYKISMTRRLEPLDRIRELGSASVPFTFDIHAMIFSEDAPNLENKLHKRFTDRRVNQVNFRKEFFKVNIDEVADVIKQEFDQTLEITMLAQAEEYNRTLQIISEKKVAVY
ncbi:DUF4041 domain-containing protein [Exiguobacterium mexicanum]|uniref:DUF4041 domain-containing protein n=1 Tax=Exiguobacterium mexicanum TaxID=340146 RepID=A0ABT7MPN9_9BACL|nr:MULTISPECIES: DUF4041 domain-containing protein [Exiguobacterium]MDL5377130.1 DUF4041 domain-containing protein [Exiguobacterium mexicanum]